MQGVRKNIPLITVIIAAINIAVFFVMELNGSTSDTGYMMQWGALSYEEAIIGKQYYRFFTSMFLHFGFEHLANNMFVFIIMGYYVENIIGRWRYLLIYVVSGLIAGVASVNYHYYFSSGIVTVSAGASGAIFGISGALLVLLIFGRGRMIDVSPGQIIMFLLLTLYGGSRNTEVDGAAHVAGFIIGAAIMYIIIKYRRHRMDMAAGE